MGKILLVEPHKILQQAISLVLFPEHEVRVEKGFSGSDAGSLKDYDLVIIDGAALRESDQWTPEIGRAIQGSKTPTIWLEEKQSSGPPKRDKLVLVKKPIEREAFQSALAALLSPQSASRERRSSVAAVSGKGDTSKDAAKRKRGEESEQAAFQFIDLVDVVEEGPAQGQGKKSARKTK